MRIVIFGMSGQLGCDVAAALAAHTVVASDPPRTDITDAKAVSAVVDHAKADWVINCAAMTHVDQCESEPSRAFAVNGIGARNVAQACAAAGATLVHISTDYVFDGNQATPYVESNTPRPVNVYGMSKLAGEWFASDACAQHYILRTSGLYGIHECRGKGTNFVETMLRLGAERETLSVVEDEVLTPTFTEDVAALIADIIDNKPRHGVYHATNEGSCSWRDFAMEIFTRCGLKVVVSGISAREWGAPARRPANSVLENKALEQIGMNHFGDWQDALSRYLSRRKR